MFKIKKIKIIFLFILMIITIFIVLFTNKNEKGFTVCYAPNNCKTLNNVPREAVANIIGFPKDFHRENSNSSIDIQANFKKGRFDEKAFYFTYKNRIYYFINAKIPTGFSEEAGLLEKSHAETFELIDANFSKDKHHVYARPDLDTPIANTILEEANPKTFTPLDWPYAKDDKNVYYINKKLKNADVNTFIVLDNKICAKDKTNYYKDGKISQKSKCQD